jgi:hypothetical protein
MSLAESPTMSTASPAGASARLEQLRRDLTAERKRTGRSALVTGIIGLIALIALGVYFTIGYRMIDETTQPERIVTVGTQLLDDKLPEVRRSAQEQVVANAPVWAEGLSQQAQAALPTGREKLEDYVLTQVEDTLKKGTVLTEDRFREFLRNNSAQLERNIQELSQSPELAESSLASLQEAVEKEIGADMLTQSREFRAALSGIIEKLDKYKSGANLTSEEQNERRILLLARALQQQERVAPERRRGSEMPVVAPAPGTPRPTDPSFKGAADAPKNEAEPAQ